jgi:predicted ATPase
VLVGLNLVNNGRGGREAYKFAQELIAIAEHEQDAILLVIADICLAYDLWVMGDFSRAQNHAERAVSRYNSAHMESYFAVYPACDPGFVALYLASNALCCLGYPDRALARGREGLALARKSSHAFTLVAGTAVSACVYALRRDAETGLKLCDEGVRVATERGFQQLAAACTAYRGCMLVELDRAAEGIVQLQEGIEGWQALGAQGMQTGFVAMLADGYRQVGRITEGLNAVAEGLAISERTGERWYDAELYRIRGELLLQQDARVGSDVESEAQACFQQAHGIAQRQHAKWWELRASVSLARLLASQGRLDEARTMLGEIYNWFTEGFDTPDLKDAKALLKELTT